MNSIIGMNSLCTIFYGIFRFLCFWCKNRYQWPHESDSETLIERIKVVVSSILEFESKYILIESFSGTSGLPQFWLMDKSEWFCNKNLLYKSEIIDSGTDRKNEPALAERKEFEYRDASVNIAFLGSFGLSGSRRIAKNHQFLDRVLWYAYKFSGGDLDEKLSLVWWEKIELQLGRISLLVELFRIPSICE